MLHYKIINRELYIYLPKKMKFDLKFHRLMASIISLVLKYKNSNRIIFSCDINISYDKMCKTYIFNVLDFFKSKGMHIYTTRKVMYSHHFRYRLEVGASCSIQLLL